MKPHLNTLDTTEKKLLSQLITKLPPQKISCHHKRVVSVAKAKEKLKKDCRQEMELEKKEKNLSWS